MFLLQGEIIYYNTITCQAIKHSDSKPCTNNAYYLQDQRYLCGVHSKKNQRTILPKDKNADIKRDEIIRLHNNNISAIAIENFKNAKAGKVLCYKMGMMKSVPLVDGFLNVFPNNKHGDRKDGLGLSTLSPMRCGPVIHNEPNLPNALLIEAYHQNSKVWPNEVDENGNPTLEFRERRIVGYNDPIPHRHKFDAKEMTKMRKLIAGANRNQPLYSVHYTLSGEEKRFTYVESRYFYCKAYEILAKQTTEFTKLSELITSGTNVIICGYDAYDVTDDLYTHYCDETKAFGHELALYCLLLIENEDAFPWNVYRQNHLELYDNIAHM